MRSGLPTSQRLLGYSGMHGATADLLGLEQAGSSKNAHFTCVCGLEGESDE